MHTTDVTQQMEQGKQARQAVNTHLLIICPGFPEEQFETIQICRGSFRERDIVAEKHEMKVWSLPGDCFWAVHERILFWFGRAWQIHGRHIEPSGYISTSSRSTTSYDPSGRATQRQWHRGGFVVLLVPSRIELGTAPSLSSWDFPALPCQDSFRSITSLILEQFGNEIKKNIPPFPSLFPSGYHITDYAQSWNMNCLSHERHQY